MLTSTFFSLALVGAASAQSTVQLFLIDTDPQSLVASIVASDATATTYQVQCPSNALGEDCGYPSPITVVEGPKTVSYSVSLDGFALDFHCDMSGTTEAACSMSMGGESANSPGSSFETLTGTDISFLPVVVTAGGGAAAASTAPASGAASTTMSTAASSTAAASTSGASASGSSSSGTGALGLSSTTVSGSAAQVSSTSSSTAGMAMITGNVKIVGGAAAAAILGLAAL
jgi:hypothetical protein